MAKSKIIKDLANGTAEVVVTLKRTKVLLQELNSPELLSWVNCELMGYSTDDELPQYRVCTGNLYGTYIKGSMASHMRYTNVPLPLGKMPADIKKELLAIRFYEGIESLRQLQRESSEEHRLGKQIPADFYAAISTFNNDPYMVIVSAEVLCSNDKLQSIISAIESKLLDVLCYLEKEFGLLDELDIDTSSKDEKELSEIAQHLSLIIYNDKRVVIGDNNKISKSSIASNPEEK